MTPAFPRRLTLGLLPTAVLLTVYSLGVYLYRYRRLFTGGSEPGKGPALPARTQDFYAGKEMYNFRWPRLYTLEALPGDTSALTIQFRKDTQISRVEIEY